DGGQALHEDLLPAVTVRALIAPMSVLLSHSATPMVQAHCRGVMSVLVWLCERAPAAGGVGRRLSGASPPRRVGRGGAWPATPKSVCSDEHKHGPEPGPIGGS